MKKILAIVAAAIIIAAAGGIGIASLSRPKELTSVPVETNPNIPVGGNNTENISSDDTYWMNSLDNIPGYVGLRSLGYNDQTARYLSSVKLDMISSNNTYYHYVQTTPNGTRAESILSYSPNEQFNTTGHEKITVSSGFDIFAKQVQVDKLDQGYHVIISYFIPLESTPDDVKEYLGLAQQVNAELPGVQYASAEGTLIYGTGVALESTVITSAESAGTIITAAPVENIGTTLKKQATADYVREVQQMFVDKQIAEEAAAKASQRAGQTADRLTREAVDQAIRDQLLQQKIDLRRVADRAAREEAAEALSKTSGRVVTGLATAWGIYNSLDDYFRLANGIDSARDCYNNPTNRLTQDAQKNDPHYKDLGENLDSAQEGLAVTTVARVGVQGFEAAAGASTGFLGGIALGGATQGMDAMLWNSQTTDISKAINGITPCTPCPEDSQNPPPPTPPQPVGDHTPGPGEPGFYYSIGPRDSYEPPERKQVQCKPQEPNKIRVVIHEGSTTTRRVSFEASANVTDIVPLNNGMIYVDPNKFEGKGTGHYLETQGEDPCIITTEGEATMKVTVRKHHSADPNELAEVNIVLSGPLAITQSPDGCAGEWPTSTGHDDIYFCNFFDVDPKIGGHYKNSDGPLSEIGSNYAYYDDCELYTGPFVSGPT